MYSRFVAERLGYKSALSVLLEYCLELEIYSKWALCKSEYLSKLTEDEQNLYAEENWTISDQVLLRSLLEVYQANFCAISTMMGKQSCVAIFFRCIRDGFRHPRVSSSIEPEILRIWVEHTDMKYSLESGLQIGSLCSVEIFRIFWVIVETSKTPQTSLQHFVSDDWFGYSPPQKKKQQGQSRRKSMLNRKDASSHNVNNYEPCNHPGEACTPNRHIGIILNCTRT